MKRIFSLFLGMICWLGASPLLAQTCPSVAQVAGASLDSLDQLAWETCEETQLLLHIGAANAFLADSSLDEQTRGDICLSLIADELQARSKLPGFEADGILLQAIVREMEAQQYFLALSQPSDWKKLFHYAKQGRFAYIIKRFMDRGVPFYVIWLEGLLLFLEVMVWLRNRKTIPVE
jgi:hypothetical protein